jgi:hypothetical protein
MKLLLILLSLICLCNVNCKKDAPVDTVYTGKLIVNGPCDHYAVAVTSGNIDTALVVTSWLDTDNDTTYTNAFAVANFCTFGAGLLQKGDVFTFTIDPNPMVQTCPICGIAVAVPPKQIAAINVHKVP